MNGESAEEGSVTLCDLTDNLLYYGDNLDVLPRHVRDESVDLIYLDPPFNSNADYNVLFTEHGVKSAAQIRAFNDYGARGKKTFGTKHDVIFWYSKSPKATRRPESVQFRATAVKGIVP